MLLLVSVLDLTADSYCWCRSAISVSAVVVLMAVSVTTVLTTASVSATVSVSAGTGFDSRRLLYLKSRLLLSVLVLLSVLLSVCRCMRQSVNCVTVLVLLLVDVYTSSYFMM